MKRKVYIETSVISYLTARPSKNVIEAGHQQSTYMFWDRCWKEGRGHPLAARVSSAKVVPGTTLSGPVL